MHRSINPIRDTFAASQAGWIHHRRRAVSEITRKVYSPTDRLTGSTSARNTQEIRIVQHHGVCRYSGIYCCTL